MQPTTSKQAPTAGGGAPPESSRVESGPVGSASLLYPVCLSSVVIKTGEEYDSLRGRQVFDVSGSPVGVIEGLWFDEAGRVITVEMRLGNGVLVAHRADDFVVTRERIVFTGSSVENIVAKAKALLAEAGTSLNVRARDVALAEEKERYILLVLKTGLFISIPKRNPDEWSAFLRVPGYTCDCYCER